MKPATHRSLIFLFSFLTIECLASCGDNAEQSISALSTPLLTLSGTGTSAVSGTNYVFATSAGTVNTANNTVTAIFNDPNPPLGLYSSSLFSESMYSGSCTSMATLVATQGSNSELITTQLSATGCTDQAVLNVNIDTTQVYDYYGYNGTDAETFTVTVDLAPVVTAAATGNTLVNGSGTTEGSSGYFSIAGDNSIVVTFSKDLTTGTLTGGLSGCAATLGTPAIVTGSNGKTVAWPLAGFSGFAPGATCSFSVSAVKDSVGNADDPADVNLNTTITFH